MLKKQKVLLSVEEIEIKNIELESRAREICCINDNIPLTYEYFYYMAVVDKSIKLMDSFCAALESNNVTVLQILTRVQLDCVLKAYAPTLVNDTNKFCEDVCLKNRRIDLLKDQNGKKMSDRNIAIKVGKWLNEPIYDVYKELCGFVHFSSASMDLMITNSNDANYDISMFSLTRNYPSENEEKMKRLSLELANLFSHYGEVLINSIFEPWYEQYTRVYDKKITK